MLFLYSVRVLLAVRLQINGHKIMGQTQLGRPLIILLGCLFFNFFVEIDLISSKIQNIIYDPYTNHKFYMNLPLLLKSFEFFMGLLNTKITLTCKYVYFLKQF